MRTHRRFLSGALATVMALSLAAPATAADSSKGTASPKDQERGSISTTLRLDYAQKMEELKERQVTLSLMRDNQALGSVKLGSGEVDQGLNQYGVTYSARNQDGGDLGGGEWPDYLDVTISDLPKGNYTLKLTGEGYVPYSQSVTLKDYSQAIVVGTGDETFGLGDVNGDKVINEADKNLMAGALGKVDSASLKQFDLNGDQVIDIVDLAYVSRQNHAEGKAEVFDTVMLAPKVDFSEVKNVTNGDIRDLFLDNGQAVTFQSGGQNLEIPLNLMDTPQLSSIEIVTPEGQGAIQRGSIFVTDEDNQVTEYPFDNTLPVGIHALSPREGSNVITIDLGNRVPVKKVTVSVTQSNGGYVVVDTIKFLKDIVPENPVSPIPNQVRSVQVTEGDGQISLSWSQVPNVMGYKVTYWPENTGVKGEVRTSTTTAVVKELKNLTTYVFTVTPVSDGWEGQPSAPVKATPQPAKAPDAPDMVRVKAGEGELSVSWNKSKSATSYEVYYTDVKDAPIGSYQQAGGALSATSTTIQNLTNGTPYYLYVVAVNTMGKSAPSKIATGTPVAVDYKEPLGLPKDLTRITRDQVESITLNDPENYSRTKSTMPFTTDYLMDNNYRTNWTSESYGDGNYSRSKQIIYTFKEPVDMGYVVYVPRADGYEDSMRLYGVTVWCKGDDLKGAGTKLVTMDGKNQTPIQGKMGNGKDGYFVVLPFPPTEDIVKIAIDIEQTNYGAVGLSEVIFYQYDPSKALDAQIDKLFVDEAHTKLASGVTQEQITALTQALQGNEGYYFYPDTMKDELKLASELVTGPSSGVVLSGIQSRSSGADAAKYQQGGSDLQPLGVAASAGQQITVYAQGIPQGETVTLWATQTYAEAATWQVSMGKLQNGRNVLTVPKIGSQTTPRGGSLYITYGGTNPEQITLHTRRATDIPVLELSGWYQLDESARQAKIDDYVKELANYAATIPAANKTSNALNVTEISMPTVLLSVPATAVMDSTSKGGEADQCQTLYRNVEAWEQLMHIAKVTQGIDKTYGSNDMTSRQNVRYMQMFAGAFMYAAGSHIGVEYSSCGGLVNGKPVAGSGTGSLFGWGIAHEIGHNMDKLGKAECTNNIYALMAQTFDNQNNTGISRLESSNKYPEIFEKVAKGNPGASNDVFIQLGMYWQLHLAYDGKLGERNGPLDFYNRFFKVWKEGKQFTADDSYEDKVALVASYVADRNLTDFFTRWGMELSKTTKDKLAQYPKETRAIWYLSDASRRDRLNQAANGAGTVTANVQKQGDHQVVVNLQSTLTAGTLQGYEIRRNDIPVGFTTGSSFTDEIGSVNNMSFTYTVQAYDTLGNPIGGAVKAGEIRVAYDKTVDPDTYDLSRTDDTVTITMKNGAVPVSGIKLTGAGALAGQGAYTVSVTEKDKTVTAKSGDYSKNEAVNDTSSYLAYFNKPEADSNDTRIWVYDVETLVMTNVPENAQVELISYAGDDVAFAQGGAVGVLEKDYRYGTGTEDVIRAGTLVITGTYRGDPVYNTLRIKGEFATTTVTENGEQEITSVQRYLDGYALFFAEIPKDGQVSDISDGIFIFVPNVQKEAELQGEHSHCTVNNLLPTRMMVEFYRTDDPNSAEKLRLTASTSWIYSPGGDELPTIALKGGNP